MGWVRSLTAGAGILLFVATASACRSAHATASVPDCATQRPSGYDVQPTTPASAPPSAYGPAGTPSAPAPTALDTSSGPDIGSALDALMHRIYDDVGLLAHSGVFMSSWGPDTTTGTIFVTLLPGTCTRAVTLPAGMVAQAQRVFDSRYGRGRVVVKRLAVPQNTQD